MKRCAWLLGSVSAWVALVGCSSGTGEVGGSGTVLIVTLAPAGEASLHPDPSQRFVSGTRIAALDLEDGGVRLLSQGLDAAGSPSLTIDGRRVIFVARETTDDPFSLFSAEIDGSNRQRLVGNPHNCGSAAELPDGSIVFSASVEDGRPPPQFGSAWALFVLTPDSGAVQRITFSGLTEIDPYVLSDGRVLYSQWLPEGDGRPAPGSFALFAVHPDGTGASAIHGQHGGAVWKLRPRQATSGDLYFVAGHSAEESAVGGTLWAAPNQSGFSVTLSSALPTAVEPASEDRFLVATLRSPVGESGLILADRKGQILRRVQSPDAAWEIIEAVEVRSRRRPQGQLSMIDPTGDRGLMLAIDARPAGPLGERATTARLRRAGTPDADGQILGDVHLAADGSFFATVPADVPLLVDVLDGNGEVLMKSLTPVWVRPKEIRNCVGCHEDPETAPPNRRPMAVLEEPIDLVGEEN